MQYLQEKVIPKFNDNQCALCEKGVAEEEVKHKLKKMKTSKSLWNKSLTKEFY